MPFRNDPLSIAAHDCLQTWTRKKSANVGCANLNSLNYNKNIHTEHVEYSNRASHCVYKIDFNSDHEIELHCLD